MKRTLLQAAFGAALLAAGPAVMAQCSAGSTLIVGPSDQYAFQWCNGTTVTQIGLNFASSVNEYQFKKTDGSNLMTLNPTGGNYVRMGSPDGGNYAQVSGGGDLTFVGGGDYLVGNNRYAFRSVGDQDNGLFFNVSSNQYEFRDGGALAGLAIKANNSGADEAGDVTGAGSASFEDEIVGSTSGGNDYAVKGIGQLAPTLGYLGVQGGTDFDGNTGFSPIGQEIGVLGISTGVSATDNSGVYGYSNGTGVTAEHTGGNSAELATATHAGVFNGDVLVNGNISGTFNQPTLNGLVNISGSGFNNANTIGLLRVGGAFSALGFDNNELQAYSTGDTATGTLFLNYWGGNVDILNGSANPNGTLNVGSGNFYVSNATDRVGVGTTAPGAKFAVSQGAVARALDVIYTSSTSPGQVANISTTTALSGGNDLLQLAMATGSSTGASFIEAELDGIKFQVNGDGHIGVGTLASSVYAIQACGSVRATEVVVETGWCDFVFDEDYRLAPLSEVEAFIAANKHLPGIPSAAEVEGNGLPLAQMSANFMQKIEELTLYTIDQEKEIDALKAQIDELKALLTATAK
jgi:hypothetical protein